MDIRPSQRIAAFGGYAFDVIDKRVARLREAGVDVIDFGVGDPREPTPELVRRATREGVDRHAAAGYPSYVGGPAYREAVAGWMARRFDVAIDPGRQVCATIGSKEAVVHFAEGVVDPGDVVLVPSPGYPPYDRGTRLAEGRPVFYPIDAGNDFLPALEKIPDELARAAKLLWVCHPHAPSGRVLPTATMEAIVRFCADNAIILAADEAYSEIWFDGEPPRSFLELSTDGVVAFHSLSKRSAMTGYRIGWVAGDERLVDIFKKVKTNIDSGTPDFVQDGAIAALGDERHVAEMRARYRRKRDVLLAALLAAGLPPATCDSTLYVWQRAPGRWDGLALAERLLAKEIAVVTMPGAWLAEPLADGRNPGEKYVRFALVPTEEETRAAADRLRRLRL